jgi:hypothetical protein
MYERKLFAIDLDVGPCPQGYPLIDPGYEEEHFGEKTLVYLQWTYWLDQDNPQFSLCIALSNSGSGMFSGKLSE